MVLNIPGQMKEQLFKSSKENISNSEKIKNMNQKNAISISGCAFKPLDTSVFVTYNDTEGTVRIPTESSGNVGFITPINIPDGNTITEITLVGYSAGTITWKLYKFGINKNGTGEGYPYILTGVMNTKKTCSILIENEKYLYFLSTSAITKDSDSLWGLRMEYK